MPFEEWIYGAPPKPVEFVRINGNRVIRVEIAKVGESPQIFTKDEVEGMMRTDGSPLVADQPARTVKMGDVQRDPDKEAAAPPPTLTAPGEKLPDSAQQSSWRDEARSVPQAEARRLSRCRSCPPCRPAKGSRGGASRRRIRRARHRLGPRSKPADPNSGAAASPGGTPPADATQPH